MYLDLIFEKKLYRYNIQFINTFSIKNNNDLKIKKNLTT